MRLFVAIDLPLSVKKKVEKELVKIKQLYPDFRWVPRENFHITLQFYGERKDEEKIKEQLERSLFDQQSFYLYSTYVGLFINKKIVIYLGFRREKKLEQLVDKVKAAVTTNSYGEKKFIPHLTLARCRIPSKQQYFALKKRLSKLKINISFPVKKVTLFESILEGKAATYKKKGEIFLI